MRGEEEDAAKSQRQVKSALEEEPVDEYEHADLGSRHRQRKAAHQVRTKTPNAIPATTWIGTPSCPFISTTAWLVPAPAVFLSTAPAPRLRSVALAVSAASICFLRRSISALAEASSERRRETSSSAVVEEGLEEAEGAERGEEAGAGVFCSILDATPARPTAEAAPAAAPPAAATASRAFPATGLRWGGAPSPAEADAAGGVLVVVGATASEASPGLVCGADGGRAAVETKEASGPAREASAVDACEATGRRLSPQNWNASSAPSLQE